MPRNIGAMYLRSLAGSVTSSRPIVAYSRKPVLWRRRDAPLPVERFLRGLTNVRAYTNAPIGNAIVSVRAASTNGGLERVYPHSLIYCYRNPSTCQHSCQLG
jgi:hypothetical protein